MLETSAHRPSHVHVADMYMPSHAECFLLLFVPALRQLALILLFCEMQEERVEDDLAVEICTKI